MQRGRLKAHEARLTNLILRSLTNRHIAMTANKELEERLKKEIAKSGFPVEIDVQSVLEERGWAVFPTDFFMDSETGKQREVDIFAIHPQTASSGETEPIGFSPHLIIECKKSKDYCALLFSRKTLAFTLYDFTGHVFDLPFLLKERTRFPNPVTEFNLGDFLADRHLHYTKLQKVATLFPMLKPNMGLEKKDLFRAVMTLVKAQSFQVKNSIRRSPTISHSYHPLLFSFLAVVFDGPIFEVTLEKGNVELRSIQHGLVQKGFQPDYEYFGVPLKYTIDVVGRDYFPQFLSEIENDLEILSNKIRLNITDVCKYLKRPET